MRVLLLSSAYNSLTQAAHTELMALGTEVAVELFLNDDQVREGIEHFQPDLIICPMLKQKIPDDVWQRTKCIIIHPGIRGDRGPSSIDWAVLEDCAEWGVTALEASEEMDAGDIWASETFPMRAASKSSLYRNEVVRAGVQVILQTVQSFQDPSFRPRPLSYDDPDVRGRLRPVMKQADRAIDWREDDVDTILRKVRSGDGSPGVFSRILDEDVYLYGAHAELDRKLPEVEPGVVVAQRHGAILIKAKEGGVWITHLRLRGGRGRRFFKLPATQTLGREKVREVPELQIGHLPQRTATTWQEISYEERGQVGILRFDFYNGAMSTEQCRRLLRAYEEACQRPTRVIVLAGGEEYFSNGIHLNTIEAAPDPAQESWENINAIDDLVRAIFTTETHITVSAVQGSAGAGGAILALAAHRVFLREGVLLNPHYRTMHLYGSEYWTYLLPRRVGAAMARTLTQSCLPVSAQKAEALNMVDAVVAGSQETFLDAVVGIADSIAHDPEFADRLARTVRCWKKDDADKPLDHYRREELAEMRKNFFGPDRGYHTARHRFVYKLPPLETPAHLATHRQRATFPEMEPSAMEPYAPQHDNVTDSGIFFPPPQ